MERIPSPFRDSPHAEPDAVKAGLAGLGEPLRSEIHGELRVDPDRQRLRSGNANIDPFDISDIVAKYAPTRGDPTKGNINNEIDFNWKRFETYGKPDYAEMRAYQDQGWRPVMHHHFPGRFARPGANGEVIVKDMILMERPMRLTVKARSEELHEATRAMMVNRQKVRATPDGQSQRIVYTDRDTREPIEIPA